MISKNGMRKFLFEELRCFDEKESTGVLLIDEKERKLGVATELGKIHLWRRFLDDKNLGLFD